MATLRNGPALALCLMGLSTMLVGCSSPAPLPAAGKAAEPARQIPEQRPGWGEPLREAAIDCVGLARAALAAGAGPPGLGLRLVGGSVGIDDDLGLAGATGPPATGCVLIVEAPRAQPPEARRLVGRETLRSQYGDGVELVANPAHVQLQRDLAKAERRGGDAPRIVATGEPTVDLIGNLAEAVAAGIDKVSRLQEASALRQDLAASAAEIERPRLRRYSYETVQVEAQRGGLSRVALQDVGAGTVSETVSRTRETRLFRLDEGRRAEDVGPAAGDDAVDLAALGAWERTPPPMRLSTVLAQLLEVGALRRATADELLAGWSAAAEETAVAALAAAVVASLVRIDGGEKEGAGFFVTADRVLTLDRLVRGSDLVRVTAADGRNSYALVERRDRRRGLALLRMPATTAAFSPVADRAVPPDAVLAWPGGPPAGASGRLLRDSAGDRLLWQPGAPAQPPLDGAPAIVDGEVVAMVAETRELGATLLPASELRAFLAVAP